MIFVDANIPMYLVGADHPHKSTAVDLVERAVGDREPLVTSAEVFQEVLHRFTALRRPDAIQPTFDLLRDLVDETFAVEAADVDDAKDLVLGGYGLSARDALHVAVMRRHDLARVMSFDRGFDRVPGLTRIG